MENVAPGFRGHHSFIATALFQMIKRRSVHSSLILQWSGLCITIDLTWLALSEDEYDVLGLGLGVIVTYWGARNGTVSESCTASHQCGPGSNPGVEAMCGLGLLLVLSLCSERFFSRYSGFPLSSKTNISKFQFDQEAGRQRTTMWMCYLKIVIYLFVYLFIYYISSEICILSSHHAKAEFS